ncbi:MAG: hypothetical protein KH230_02675 [Enterocloster asparagiformis]|nr:hypothetical protein [Enterocloster asparagiformis]
METYDYSEHGPGNDISAELDAMSPKELQAVAQAIRDIRRSSAHARQDSSRAWFNAAILPALRDFAEMTASVLEITDSDRPIVCAVLRNAEGLDITNSCKCMKMALNLADYIHMAADEGGVALSLTFDCQSYID